MYNKEQIEKNYKLIKHSTDECISKLIETEDEEKNMILRMRLNTNFALVDVSLDALKRLPQDQYLETAIANIEECKNRWIAYNN